jgi:protein-S-isoprenylcysteine O-methyltransferase Ste14
LAAPRAPVTPHGTVTFTVRCAKDVLRVAIFACVSSALVYFSRASLKVPGSHGFYRLFAWECILGLFLLNFVNVQQWFGDPLSVRQVISWFLLITCIVPAVHGVQLLRTQGKPDAGRRHDASLVWIETTTELVTSGAFKYIRHPLYSSLLLLAWGVFFKRPSWGAGGVVVGATAFLLATAKAEEVENVRYFGAAYRAYMQRTKMFIPFVF